MTQPTAYTPATDFSAEESASTAGRSTVRTAALDAEFAALETILAQYRTNLGVLQRDDTELRDGVVKPHSLSASTVALFNSSVTPRGDWLTATAYAALDLVSQGGNVYVCLAAHTSGTFSTDLAAAKWMPWSFDLAADAELSAIAGLASAADTFPYFTGSGTASLATLTSFARTLLALTSAASVLQTIGGVEAVAGHISGLVPSNNGTDASNDIDVSAGVCIDSTGAYVLRLSSAMTKRLDASWSAGTNQGGLDTGSEAVSTWYYIWLIRKDSDASIDVLFSASASSPTMPAGYTYKRLVGAFFNNSAGDINAFTATEIEGGGLNVQWASPQLVVDLSNTLTTSRRLDTVRVPVLVCTARLYVYMADGSSAFQAWVGDPAMTDAAPSLVGAPGANFNVASGVGEAAEMLIRTDSSGRIAARATLSTVDTYRVWSAGYIWGRR